jgi:hypothetical protein
MLDALTALSVASSIVQFVDFGAKLLSDTRELYKSSDGCLIEHGEVAKVTTDLKELSLGLKAHRCRELQELSKTCCKLADELLTLLSRIEVPGANRSRSKSFHQATRVLRNKDNLRDLEKRLDRIREHLGVRLLAVMR